MVKSDLIIKKVSEPILLIASKIKSNINQP